MTGTEGPWEVAGGGTTEGWRDEKMEREKSVLKDIGRSPAGKIGTHAAPRSERLHWIVIHKGRVCSGHLTIASKRLVRCFLLKRAYWKQANKADHIFTITPA